jgi:hypothetical protein
VCQLALAPRRKNLFFILPSYFYPYFIHLVVINIDLTSFTVTSVFTLCTGPSTSILTLSAGPGAGSACQEESVRSLSVISKSLGGKFENLIIRRLILDFFYEVSIYKATGFLAVLSVRLQILEFFFNG